MRISSLIFILTCCFFMLAVPQGPASADLYSNGTLTAGSGGGLVGTGEWNSTSTILTWTVTAPDTSAPGQHWNYVYTFTVPSKAVSHVIIEVSGTFGPSNIFSGTTAPYVLQYFGPDYDKGNSNPGMPSSYQGIKWDTTGGPLSFSWTIVTDRAPMWGSFYAKDGKDGGNKVYAYSNGDLVAVPDTNTTATPIPASAWLLGSALVGLFGLKKRLRNRYNASSLHGRGTLPA
jgi:hypothetical protein